MLETVIASTGAGLRGAALFFGAAFLRAVLFAAFFFGAALRVAFRVAFRAPFRATLRRAVLALDFTRAFLDFAAFFPDERVFFVAFFAAISPLPLLGAPCGLEPESLIIGIENSPAAFGKPDSRRAPASGLVPVATRFRRDPARARGSTIPRRAAW